MVVKMEIKRLSKKNGKIPKFITSNFIDDNKVINYKNYMTIFIVIIFFYIIFITYV